MATQIVNHPFEDDIDLLMSEKDTLIAHYKNEGIYFDHRIMMSKVGFEFTLLVILYDGSL